MGFRNGQVLPNAEESSFSDALLFATMCIVGVPVDVHVTNGSVYSGVFNTASVEGIVLKKARMTKKGRTESNVADGCVVETLVVLSSELVQVVAKGALLPADGVCGKIAGDEMESAVVSTASQNFDSGNNKFGKSTMSKRRRNQRRTVVQSENGFSNGVTGTSELTHHRENGKENEGLRMLENNEGRNIGEESMCRVSTTNAKGEAVPLPSAKMRQVKDDILPLEQENCPEFELHTKKSAHSKVPDSSASFNSTPAQVEPIEETHAKLTPPVSAGVSFDPVATLVRQEDQPGSRPASVDSIIHVCAPCVSTSAGARVDQTSQSCSNAVASPPTETIQSEPNKKAKEFKLNPGAKIFSPTYPNSRSATPPVQTVPGISYIPNNPLLPVAQTEVGIGPFIPHSSVPVKVLPYNHLTAGVDIGAHPEPMVGSIGSRAPPLVRYAGQHQTIPVGSTYIHPNSQAVMVGRMGGQVMYIPISHDLVQSVPSISPAFPRPSTTMGQVQFLKHQVAGSVPGQPLMPPPPMIGGGQHLFARPPHVPLMQRPFLTNRPIAAPGTNGLYTAKFS